MLKFAILRGNDEYYIMKEANWDESSSTDGNEIGSEGTREERTR